MKTVYLYPLIKEPALTRLVVSGDYDGFTGVSISLDFWSAGCITSLFVWSRRASVVMVLFHNHTFALYVLIDNA